MRAQLARPPKLGAGHRSAIYAVHEPDIGLWRELLELRSSTCPPVRPPCQVDAKELCPRGNSSRRHVTTSEALPAEEVLSSALLVEITEHASEAAGALRAASTTPELVLELGLDFVIDNSHRPWLIEANSCPRGRLLHLAKSQPERWAKTHEEAILRPLRRLLALR